MTQDNGPSLVFTGTAGSFAPIWIKNLLLTIVTLGFYRFWAKTRVRQYLWANTKLWDEPMEYTGTGLELFLGFLVALVVFVLPVTLFSMGTQALAPTQKVLAGVLFGLFYLYAFVIASFALYRAQRYRLTRTLWRGIRGGMAHGGYKFGIRATGYYLLGVVSLGMAGPWVSAKVWNMRWNDASYGTQSFSADATARPLYQVWFYTLGAVLVAGGVLAFTFWDELKLLSDEQAAQNDPKAVLALFGWIFLFYVAIGLAFLIYQARYWQTMIAATNWGPVSARMTAGPLSWLWLAVRSFLLILPLGLGAGWIPYISWKFWMKHLELDGVPDAATLEQSTTAAPSRGEGLADALDMGAF
jgi:uncharacterized membrane protein YjgN (DUF898 family)